MLFIDTIGASYAIGEAFAMYERQQAHYGYVPSHATVFSYRPEIMRRWAELLSAIKRPMDRRGFELATSSPRASSRARSAPSRTAKRCSHSCRARTSWRSPAARRRLR